MKLILGGLLLVTTGAALPFLMVIRVLDLSLPLSVLSYVASLSGLLLGPSRPSTVPLNTPTA